MSPLEKITLLRKFLQQAKADEGFCVMLNQNGKNEECNTWQEIRDKNFHLALEELGHLSSLLEEIETSSSLVKERCQKHANESLALIKRCLKNAEIYSGQLASELKRAGFATDDSNEGYVYALLPPQDQYQQGARDLYTMAQRTNDQMTTYVSYIDTLKTKITSEYGLPDEHQQRSA